MSFRVELAVLSEHKHDCRFGLTVHNLTDQDLTDWHLQLIFERYILPESFTHGSIKQVGSFCTVTPETNTLPANKHFYTEFSVKTAPLRLYSDGLKDALIVADDGATSYLATLTPIALASPYREPKTLPVVSTNKLALIPKPNQLEQYSGQFQFSHSSQISLQTKLAENAATWLQQELAQLFAFQVQAIGQSDILYRNNPTLDSGEYQLTVSGSGVRLEAASNDGFIHASATLLQLIQRNDDNSLSIPYLKIVDKPRFKYRGMMLDCARHFHPLDRIKRLINHLAHYKFNTFHWHLTDDEGWRIEIKAFPQLTEIGAYRGKGTAIEPQYSHLNSVYGGYYSQQQARELITYASQRGITVIPEIDIPGHCRAAIKSLPHLLQDRDDRSQFRSVQLYSDNVLNPGLTGTYQFLDKVLEEVAELFPSPLIHIGADEVPDGVWLESPCCQQLMAEHNYQNSRELQGHLLRYVEKKLHTLGKRMVGWEEAQYGNKVSKDTIIYSWLNEQAALNCAKQDFDVILQPAQSTYLDMSQAASAKEPGVDWAAIVPLENAYRYEPLAEVPEHDPIRKRILGIQCALWCEIVNTQERMDYMIFPRLTAIAEACWTNKSQRNWDDYLSRLKGHLALLDKQNVLYRQPWK